MSVEGLVVAYACGIAVWGLARMPAVAAVSAPPGGDAPVPGGAILAGTIALLVLATAGTAARALAPNRPPPPGHGGSYRPAGTTPVQRRLGAAAAVALVAAAGFAAAERWSAAALIPGTWLAGGAGELAVTGRIASDPEPAGTGGAFILRVDGVGGRPARGRLQVTWRAEPGQRAPALGYGDRVLVTGTLRRPRPATVPGGYDRRAALLREGIGYELVTGEPPRWLEAPRRADRLPAALYALRRELREGLAASLPAGPRGVAAALLLDWRQDLSVTARNALADTGLIHLLAVSGQHVAMAAVGSSWLAGRGGLLPRARRWLVAAVVVLYAAVTGGPPSVLRATATYLLADLGRALARPATALSVLSWAAAAQLVYRPLWLFEPGFQLSFAATAGLVVLYPPLRRGLDRWSAWRRVARGRPAALWAAEALALTVAAQAAVLPVQVALFGRMPLAGLLGNLVAVPLSGAALAGAALAAVGGGLLLPAESIAGPGAGAIARALGWPGRLAVEGLVRVAMAAEALPLSAVTVPPAAAGPLAGAVAWIAAAVIDPRPSYARRLRPRPLPDRGLLWPALLLAIAAWGVAWVARVPPPAGTFEALFLDVGQGDGILLRFPGGRSLQVDAGGRARPGDPAVYWPARPPAVPDAVGETVTVPVLRRVLGGPPDILAVTHADRDHAGGAGAVLEQLGARQLWLGGVPGSALEAGLLEVARRRGIPVLRPRAGTRWTPAPGCAVDVLHPGHRPVESQRAVENNASLVLRVQCGGPRLLLVGDLEREGEEALLARGADVRAEVLKVSHHGSRGASHPAFLAAVRPRLAIVSVGPNPYGLPHVEALARLSRAGAVVLRTDRLGSIRVRFGRFIEVFPALPAGG